VTTNDLNAHMHHGRHVIGRLPDSGSAGSAIELGQVAVALLLSIDTLKRARNKDGMGNGVTVGGREGVKVLMVVRLAGFEPAAFGSATQRSIP
jgi:hypothetical protein